MESKISKLLNFIKGHRKMGIIAIIFIIILIILVNVGLSQNQKSVKISTPDTPLFTGNIVESEVVYDISNGINLSVDATSEILGVVTSVNKLSANANHLIDLAKESQAQNNAKKTKKLIIPANAICGGNFNGCATYEWNETSSNYFQILNHKQTHMVVIVQSMGFHLILKSTGWDVISFEVL